MARLAMVGVIVAAGLTAITASPAAAADTGDGNWNCNNGEICFKEDNTGPFNADVRNFWWGAQHSGQWCPCNGGNGGTFPETATYVRNRDTVCTVYMSDELGTAKSFAKQGDWVWLFFTLWDNSNWAHERCGVWD
jgi:hypothetical protein